MRRPAPGFAGVSGPSSDITPLPDLVHGRSRAGAVREERPVYVDLLPPCNSACPAGENIQAYLAHVEGRRARAGLACAGRGQPVCRDPRPSLLPPVRDATAIAPTSTARSRSTRSSGSWAIWRSNGRGRFPHRRVRSGKRVLVIGAGPERALGGLSPRAARARGRDPRCGPGARRDDAVRHPRLPDAPRRSGRRDRADRGVGRAHDRGPSGRGSRGRAPRGQLRRGVRRGRRAPGQAGGDSRP